MSLNDDDIGPETPDRAAIMSWRKGEQARILALGLALPAAERRRRAAAIACHLDVALGDLRGRTVGVYGPFSAEPNLRPWMEQIRAAGAPCALPVVVERHASLVFRTWQPGCR